ncbi:MAG: hypothetical protein IIC71_00820 [Acidobacteria bacterium]|nr:hypothetical protein [Acidobacteriota bacterium]
MRRTLVTVRSSVVAFAMVAAACSGVSSTTTSGAGTDVFTSTSTTPASTDSLVFGSGTFPEMFPDDFPIPASAVIGSTMDDPANGRSEAIVRVTAAQDAVVVFYDQSLRAQGYELTSELKADGRAVVTFSNGDVSGLITVRDLGSDVAEAVIRIGV